MVRSIADRPPRVLIIGGAGGIGLACAEAFAARGAELILADCDGTALTRAADRLCALSRFCDAISSASVDIFAAELANVAPDIDVLINAAGSGYVRALSMTRVAVAVLPFLRRARGRRMIVNIASTGGFVMGDGMFPYASSHEAFERLSAALEEQVRGSGIEVVNVIPQLAPGRASKAYWSDQMYELQHVDELETAARVLTSVAAARPDWRQRPPRISRRA